MLNESTIQETLEGNLQRNVQLLAVLREKGVSVEEDRNIEFHYWAWSRATAENLKQALVQNGSVVNEIVSVKEDDEDLWSITAELKTTVMLAVSSDWTKANVLLAAEFDCIYDGWGMSL